MNIVQGVNSSGLFSLLLSYKSTLSIRTLISVESNTASVILSNCSQECFFNLSTLFGELSLTGSVMVNVTYEASAYHFAPTKVVALPQEFYQPLLLGNSSRDFLANCSITDSNMGYGTDHQALFCRAQVFSLTVNYLGGALREFMLLFFLLLINIINLSFIISPFTSYTNSHCYCTYCVKFSFLVQHTLIFQRLALYHFHFKIAVELKLKYKSELYYLTHDQAI